MKTIKKLISGLLIAATLVTLALSAVACSSEGGEEVMEYKGYEITEGMYRYWMKQWKDDYVTNYSDVQDTEAFWTADNPAGGTNEDYITDVIQTRIRYYLVAQSLFDQYGLKLTDEAKEDIQSDLDDQIEYYGTKSAFNEHLREAYGMDINMLEEVYTFEARYTQLYSYLYSTSGKLTASAEELDEYYHNYYARVKYIMFLKSVRYAYDEDGNRITDSSGYYTFEELTEEEQAEVTKTANEIYESVRGGESIDEPFEEFMSEFHDVESYPNGFYITADEYALHTATVTEAALNMEVGEVRLVENDSCYFVVQKFDLIDKAYTSAVDKGQFTYLVSYCNGEKFANQFEALAKEITEYSDVMGKYQLRDL